MRQLLKVLIVEDSPVDARLVERVLKQSGYDIQSLRVDTADALKRTLAEITWDVIISDYSMPGFGGTEALKIVQTSNLDIPFIMVSGVMGEDVAVAAMRAGAHDYLMKDNLSRLVPAIEREIREAGIRHNQRMGEQQIRKLSRALARSASLVTITDRTGQIEYVNEAFCEVTGYTKDEVIGQDIANYLSLESETFDAIWQRILDNEFYQAELYNYCKDNTGYWSALTITPVYNPDEEIQSCLIMQEDISRRKQLEAELRRYTERLEQMVEERTKQLKRARDEIEIILDNTRDAIVLSEANGDIQKSNPAFRRIFGTKVSKAIEELIYSIDDETIEGFAEKLLGAVYDNQDSRLETDVEDLNGRKIDLDLTIVPIARADDERAGVLMSMHDVTHIKEVDRLKTRFVANIAHDLASPVSILKNQLYFIRRLPEKLLDRLDIIEQQILRLEQFIIELRTLSQLDRGNYTIDFREHDLNEMVLEAVAARQVNAQRKDLVLIHQLGKNLPPVSLDKDKFWRVLINLIDNAIRYTNDGGQIFIRTELTDEAIGLVVEDTGIGISQSALPYIFERFYRSDEAQDMVGGGSGIGLSIVKEIVDLHHGQIEVMSEVGVGTTFAIYLSYSASEDSQ